MQINIIITEVTRFKMREDIDAPMTGKCLCQRDKSAPAGKAMVLTSSKHWYKPERRIGESSTTYHSCYMWLNKKTPGWKRVNTYTLVG